MPPLVDPCQRSQFSGPSISRISTYLSLREKKTTVYHEKVEKEFENFHLWELLWREGGRNSCQLWASITPDDVLLKWKAPVVKSTFIKSDPSNISAELCLSAGFKTSWWTFSPECDIEKWKKHLNIYKMVSVITWNSVPGFHIITSFHIITDLSSAVFGEVMLKLASSLLQHHPLHIHYPSTIPTLAYSSTIKTPALYMLSLPALSLACIKDVVVKARYVLFFSSGRV